MEAISDARAIDLGGSKQRATLGFLLLQPNQVVPTSRLLSALWSVEEAPVTARKILQNAIWGLRRKLSAAGAADEVRLRTQAPGYTLEVAEERIDLHVFRRMVEQGRTHLAAGAPDEAATHLHEALRLWRGTVLSDLVEVGVMWPELTMVENSRLDVLEDYFEAQLECGRHYAVLGEIEALVESEPLRERSCGQLMRALYRCGRQADALGVFSRLRSSLVEDLGLEPSRELRELQQAILVHDPALKFTPPVAPITVRAARPSAAAAAGADDVGASSRGHAGLPETRGERAVRPAPPSGDVGLSEPRGEHAMPSRAHAGVPESRAGHSALPLGYVGLSESSAEHPARARGHAGPSESSAQHPVMPGGNADQEFLDEQLASSRGHVGLSESSAEHSAPSRSHIDPAEPRPQHPSPPVAERQEVSALLARLTLTDQVLQGDSAAADALLDRAELRIREEIENHGGTVAAAMGTDLLGVFPARADSGDHAERALRAATALRAALGATASGDLTVKAAVVTGRATVRARTTPGAAPLQAGGALLHQCQLLLPTVPQGEIHVCARTREATLTTHACGALPGTDERWQLLDAVPGPGRYPAAEPSGELDLLRGLMEHSTRWSRPHLVFVLGPSGAARTQLLADFRRVAAEQPDVAPVLFHCEPATVGDGGFVLHRALLAAYCGLSAQDDAQVARERFESALRHLVGDGGYAGWLAPLLGPVAAPGARQDEFGAEEREGVRQFVAAAARKRPLVLIIDELHRGDEPLLHLVAHLADPARRLPVLVVAGAEPEFLQRHAAFAMGRHHSTVLTTDARTGGVLDRLFGSLALSQQAGPARGGPWDDEARSRVA
ncbi:BTAD domain-containing putative transcriptional regulator [Streptomyces coeruleorubidus]|uniref:BTAD domain-containing putative transcriptional regulator n=1 Tax=Streptomyces coeruleorubidus TaxID=116188 RepID=UPI0037AF1511